MLIPFNTICKKYDLKIRGILHLGAHLLEEKQDYDNYNVSKVVWIEGNPQIAEQSKLKCDGHTHTVYNYLVSEIDDEEVEFNIANNGQSSSILKLGKHSTYHPDVVYTNVIKAKTKSLKTIIDINELNVNDYNFLNIDLQGVELKALKGLGEYLHYIDYIYTEVNSGNVYEGNDLIEDIDSYLSTYGFVRVETEFTGAEWGDAFYIKKSKRTQIVTHIIPSEIDEYANVIDNLLEASKYLDKKDWISIYATLNLSPELIRWDESKLKQEYFIQKFNAIKEKASWANELIFEIIDDNSILGTTAQKRKAIEGNYDQFIFLDCDIAFNPMTLKYMLMASERITDKYYFLTPQTVKLWDYTWDLITHDDFLEKEYGYEKLHDPMQTYNQNIGEISVDTLENLHISDDKATVVLRHKLTNQYNRFINFKFACGWFTMYSKEVLNLIGIPDWLGHYGPEDTYMMYAAQFYRIEEWSIYQYVLQGIYVSENYIQRDTTYMDKIKLNNLKSKFREEAESKFQQELSKLQNTIKKFN